MKGGAGASEWGVKAFGDINQQSAASNQDNKIAIRGGSKGGCWDMGFTRKKRSTKKGGSLIGELAAPVILLTAQQNYKPRRSMKKFRKNRKSRSYRRK
jgi:hypothetical protein